MQMIISFKLQKSTPLVVLFSMFFTSTVLSQSIPSDELAIVKSDCIQKCTEAEQESLTCDILCSCVSNRFQSELKYSDFQAILKEMDSGNFTPSIKRFLDETGLVCTAELGNVLAEQEKIKKNTN